MYEFGPRDPKPAGSIAAMKFGRCSEWMEVECTVKDFRHYIVESQHDRVDVRSILNLPPVMDSWFVRICDEGVFLLAQRAVDLSIEVLPGLPPIGTEQED